MKKDKVNATVVLHGAATWPLKKRNAVVKWLHKVAQDLWHDPTNYAKRFRARHLAGITLALLASLWLSGCTGRDLLSERELEQAWQAREEDKRPVVSDEAYKAMSEEDRKKVIPQSLDDARHLERDQAFGRQKGK